jgi:hypothetical protein
MQQPPNKQDGVKDFGKGGLVSYLRTLFYPSPPPLLFFPPSSFVHTLLNVAASRTRTCTF